LNNKKNDGVGKKEELASPSSHHIFVLSPLFFYIKEKHMGRKKRTQKTFLFLILLMDCRKIFYPRWIKKTCKKIQQIH